MAGNEGAQKILLQGVIVERVVTLDEMLASLLRGQSVEIDPRPRVEMIVRSNMGWSFHGLEVVVTGLERSVAGLTSQYGWKGVVVKSDNAELLMQPVEGEIDFVNPLEVSSFMGHFRCYRWPR